MINAPERIDGASMKSYNFFLIGLWIVFVLSGCAHQSAASPEKAIDRVKVEYDEITDRQKSIWESLEQDSDQPVEIKPVMPAYNPLEDHIISFSMMDENLKMILFSLAKAISMNLVIDPSIDSETDKVTLNFNQVTAADALREIMDIYDIYYEVDDNMIRIKPFEEKIFKLNFLDTNVETSFDVGGDVLGSSNSATAGELSGKIKLTGKGAEKGNPYDVIDDMVRKIKSKEGQYSLNRLSGTLYVKDTPMAISAISRVVNHFKEMMGRQILIETRIIEVSLSDEFKYGIDWDAVYNKANNVKTLVSGTMQEGILTLAHSEDELSLESTIEAIRKFGDTKVISNPSIRTKHGQASIISVGTSITYKKTEKTTATGTGDNRQEDTTAEVSTLFDGLMLGVIPFIEEDNRITLQVNPIKSEVDRTSLELEGGTSQISLPKVNIKEMSTTITLNDREVVILGGLIDKNHVDIKKGVPILSSIPLIRYLFISNQKVVETRELVIIMSVTVI